MLSSRLAAMLPANTRQVASISMRMVRDQPAAAALEQALLPDAQAQWKRELEAVGVSVSEIDRVTFVLLPGGSKLDQSVGIVEGPFSARKVRRRARMLAPPTMYRKLPIYSTTGKDKFFLADATTLVFGPLDALKRLLDVQDGVVDSLDSNAELSEAIARVDHADIWSALDANATRNLLRYSTGAVAKLADYNAVKKSIRSAQYTLDVTSGLKFDFTLSTADAFTATTLSSLLQAYFVFQKMTSAKPALPAGQLKVESDSADVRISLEVPEAGLQEFLKSQFFVSVSR